MIFSLTVNLDNAAFQDATLSELRRFLSMALADKVHESMALVSKGRVASDDGKVMDSNGNTVGRYEVRERCVAEKREPVKSRTDGRK